MAQLDTNRIARIASLMGEPARTAMLVELMDGRSLTAGELARAARVTPQTASRHLALLVEGGLLATAPRGRHRYHRLASPDVARLVESVMQLAVDRAPAGPRVVPGPRDERLRTARRCYDHIAGRLGVAIADRLLDDGAVALDLDAGTGEITARAAASLGRMGMAMDHATGAAGMRAVCRPCLDWSERRHHVSGRLGAAILAHCIASGWLRRRAADRALEITPPGAAALRDWLGTARWHAVERPPAR